MISEKSQLPDAGKVFVSGFSDKNGLSSVSISITGMLSNIPSVANKHKIRYIPKLGKARIVHDSEARDTLVTIGELIHFEFRRKYGIVPAFREDEWLCVMISLSARNHRKDPDNCSKGLVDFGLVSSGLLKNDRRVVVLSVPYHILGASKDETVMRVCRLSSVLPDVRQLWSGLSGRGD